MKPHSIVCNRRRLVSVKFYLNRCRFAVVIANCLGGSLFWDTLYNIVSATASRPDGQDIISCRPLRLGCFMCNGLTVSCIVYASFLSSIADAAAMLATSRRIDCNIGLRPASR